MGIMNQGRVSESDNSGELEIGECRCLVERRRKREWRRRRRDDEEGK